jgi:DNA-binding response OmpR family regulator
MYRIVVVSSKPSLFTVMAQALQADTRITVEWVASGEEALTSIKRAAPDLMLLDEKSGETADFALARSIILHDALINVAMVSRLPEKEFHESAEGLGILMQLPPQPGPHEVETLLARLTL